MPKKYCFEFLTCFQFDAMNLSFGGSIVLCFLLATVKDTSGQTTPSNAVAEIGGRATLSCSATLLYPNWFMSKDGTSTNQLLIATSCNVNAGLQNHYDVDKTGGPYVCNLIVFNVTMDQAGVYWCVGSDRSNALLTILDSTPTITYNNTPDVMAEENVVTTCTLNYSGSVEPGPTLRPHFYWTNYTGNNASNVDNPPLTNSSVVSQSTVTAGRENIMPYTCRVYLQLIQTATPDYATNIPSVDIKASSPVITVLYPVDKNYISIHSTVPTEDKCVSETENLNCTADANPPAQYVWLDLKNNTNTTGAVISISSGGEYQCIASNSIRSQTYTETKNEIVTSCHSPYNLTIVASNCVDNLCTCNGNASYAEQISITCMANGIPIPAVKWRSDNSFDGLDGTIGVSLNGNYTCIATNTYGEKQYSAELTVVVYDCLEPLPPTLPPSTVAPTPESATDSPNQQNYVGAIVGAVIGVIVILNGVATGLFFWYYKKVEVSHSGKKERNNKLKLDRRFLWLKKIMPCVSEIKESTESNCLWVSLFILLGILTGIVTFPIWILLANKYEKNNETSALNRRENGEGSGSGENGRRPTNSTANQNQPTSTNQMNAIRQEDPYQNESSRENIEMNNSLRSRNLLLSDSPPSRPPPAGRPPPPPNKPTINLSNSRSKDYTVNDQQTQAANPEHTTYADLPFVPRNTLPTATPVQFLNVSNDTYAALNKT